MKTYSRKLIHDEFTHLKGKVSRQRIYQLRKKRDGLCAICGKLALYSGICVEHRFKNNNYQKTYFNHKQISKQQYQPYGPKI